MKIIKLLFSEAKPLLQEGDILLFKGQGIMSSLIKRAAEGQYSHVAVASSHNSNGDNFWECVEFREWKGGRTVSLEQVVEQNSGLIDVYRPASSIMKVEYNPTTGKIQERKITWDGKAVTNMMRRMTGLPYGWRRIFWIGQHKLPVMRWFYSIDSVVDDTTQEIIYPVCSTAVAHSASSIKYDLLHNRADKATEPSDISRSPLLHYIFTLI